MKFGVKSYDDWNFLKQFQDSADFFEIQAVKGKDYSFVKKIKKPVVIHEGHLGQGSNPVDSGRFKENLELLNLAKKLADKTDAKVIVLHCGYLVNKNCSLENSIDFIKQNFDDRICLENLTFNARSVPHVPDEMKMVLKETGCGFCFDLNHAIASANSLGVRPMSFVKSFLKLKPRHFHVGGQKAGSDNDGHLSFKDSTIPLKKYLSLFPRRSRVTLEVTTDVEKTKYDLEYVRGLVK